MVIDIHTHIGWVNERHGEFGVGDLLRWMDWRGVERAVLLALESPEASFRYTLTTECLAAAARHPDRLIAFACFDPRAVSRPEGVHLLFRRAHEAGALGYGECKVAVPLDDPRLVRHFEACEAFGWPALLHIDSVRLVDAIGLPKLEGLLQRFRRVTFIGHATGWWSHVSADVTPETFHRYNTGPVAPGGTLDRLLAAYPNLYADVSATSGFTALTRDPAFGRAFCVRHRHKLLFGTDKLDNEREPRQFELPALLDLPAAVWRDITERNPRRVLGLERATLPAD
jgi:predicted TIM-barrel fold metal-dependent hydrolase